MPHPPTALAGAALLLILLGAACGATEPDHDTSTPNEPTPAATDQLVRQPSAAPTIDPTHRAKIDAPLLSAYAAAAAQPPDTAALESLSNLIELTTQNGVTTAGALISGSPTPADLAAVGFIEQTRIGNIVAGHFPLLQLPALAALSSITRIEASVINTLQTGN